MPLSTCDCKISLMGTAHITHIYSNNELIDFEVGLESIVVQPSPATQFCIENCVISSGT